LERGEFVRVDDFKAEKARLMKAADNTLKKLRNINLRVSERDLVKLKSKAEETGIPYQTLVRSLIRQYTSGHLRLSL